MCVLFIFFQDTELELNHDVEIRAMMSLRPPGAAVGPGPWGPGPTPAVQSRCLSFKADSEMYLSQASKTVWGLFRRSLFHHHCASAGPGTPTQRLDAGVSGSGPP